MSPLERAVMQQTLEALEKFGRGQSGGIPVTVLVHNLRQALAATQPAKCWKCGDADPEFQAVCDVPACEMREALAAANSVESEGIKTVVQQEPVLFIHPDTFAMANAHVGAWKPGHELPGSIPLYTTPQPAPQQDPDALRKALAEHDDSLTAVYMVGRYKAKKAEHQEPVAWILMNGACNYQLFGSKKQADALCTEMQKRHDLSGSLASFRVQPLYTAPPPPAGVPPLTPGEVALMWIEESFDTMSHESCYVRGVKRGEQAVRQKAGIK